MEKFDLSHNPWIDGGLQYSFGKQPIAASNNLDGLSRAFALLALHLRAEEERAEEER